MPGPPHGTTADDARVTALLERHRDDVIAGMRGALERPGVEHIAHMRYHLGWEDAEGNIIDTGGGKMLRPALCLVSAEAVGGDARAAMPAAVAIELLHNFSLIHDDIEDGSRTRHGRATLWTLIGVPLAINAGDGMLVLAERTLLDLAASGVAPERVLAAARALNDASVALCEGQHRDLSFESRTSVTPEEYEAMIRGKTASLIAASAEIGAIAGGADDRTLAAFRRCGEALGMAFQIRDDVLGVWGEGAVTGKPVAEDIRSRKKSFPAVHALQALDEAGARRLRELYAAHRMGDAEVAEALGLLERARSREAGAGRAGEWAERAVAALDGVNVTGQGGADIKALAEFFVSRSA
jgi:geranylgeranyl diphosphate synthase type I